MFHIHSSFYFSILMSEKCIFLLRGEEKEILVNLLNNLNIFCFQQNKSFPGKKGVCKVQRISDKYFEKEICLLET